ncbi:MAG: ribonuclease Y [Candidatus Yonathbacteria bacterium RIFOXYC1_FULL_52_10]|uniref:Ribonuclease Y n=1 Tax=Candidatus Yonathbacteria bacterium RIFOXYD1_FULL_52_36 TaxID=1802730 RepID=A0A1G2SIL0_9BACT|nr:MAG: ribonuclease Y [Candidatus Yonathbacteria bacterium RIFOXYC1_FULL_52_10]OHA84927.1 MAG: ribonuclease Y [Candidatus Yonathbacteria bacterium RIFOXYD1_FULL_52_36]
MSLKIALLLASIAGVVGIAFGYFLRWLVTLGKRGSIELEVKQMMLAAKEEAQKITEEAEKKALSTIEDARREEKEKEKRLKQTEERLIKKEELLDRRQTDIDDGSERLKEREQEVELIKTKAEQAGERARLETERVAKLSTEEAKAELFRRVEVEAQEDTLIRIKKLEQESQERLERKAKDILATSIQRLAASTASETMATAVSIPSEDLKGKIIGKEGRNIRAFERAAGVELIVDDTPGAIVVSSFDPVRRQIARVALENLILDGRIQPVKIEEMVEKAKETIGKIIKDKGEQAAYECGVFNLDARLIMILGRLYFRTSYGQNVLQHSIEMAHIAGMIAQELGADVNIARAGALLHDIGKAVDHEVQGTHVEIGRRILQKFNVDERVIKAMQSHHEEYPYETIESIIVQTADAISGGRPGARRDSVENYIKRLQDLEAIANSFDGVEKTFAIQAGREIRVFVTPDKISDLEARTLARTIALRIENELKYPGEIKVNVIRELRVLEFAR